ncbi:hypothetical protein [Sphingobacterium sp.]|uniref:hypothetical protein n=1 Tax=Sphingobacterium sp. TaxID=341027 RepID=UPI002896A2F2|nr:hypothetical protein [Sphingobacterium sp.]
MEFLSEIAIAKSDFGDHSIEWAEAELIEHLISQTKSIHKDLSEDFIRKQVQSSVRFTVFDTNKPNHFTNERDRFSYDNYNKEGKCGVIAKYELKA